MKSNKSTTFIVYAMKDYFREKERVVVSCIDSVKMELEECIKLRDNIEQRLDKLKEFDDYYLSYSVVKGYPYYHMVKFQNKDFKASNENNKEKDVLIDMLDNQNINHKKKNKRTRKYLGKSTNPKVGRLQEHRLLTEARQICDANIDSLDALVASYQELNPDEIIKNLGVAYQECAGFSGEVLGIPSTSEWKRQGMAKRDSVPRYKPEHLTRRAQSGEMMRTLGEMIFANILDSLGVEYIYELPTEVNGQLKIPDFTILHPRNKQEIIIEYMGMYGDENYKIKNTFKIAEYFNGGYILGKNFFVFMDGENEHFDSNMVKTILKAIFS